MLQYSLCSSVADIEYLNKTSDSCTFDSVSGIDEPAVVQRPSSSNENGTSAKALPAKSATDEILSISNGSNYANASKSTLAEHFLLGAIDCDTMKVL